MRTDVHLRPARASTRRGLVPSAVWAALALAAVTSLAVPAASADTVRSQQINGSRALQNCSDSGRAGDFSDRALAACEAALRDQLMPEQEAAVLVNRGAMHLRRQEHALGLADFDAALAIEPNNAVAMYNRGMTLVNLRQPGPAVAALTRSLSLGVPNPYLAYYFRGVARERLGDARGAYEDYSTALEIQPNWQPAEQEMARFARVRREELTQQLAQSAPR